MSWACRPVDPALPTAFTSQFETTDHHSHLHLFVSACCRPPPHSSCPQPHLTLPPRPTSSGTPPAVSVRAVDYVSVFVLSLSVAAPAVELELGPERGVCQLYVRAGFRYGSERPKIKRVGDSALADSAQDGRRCDMCPLTNVPSSKFQPPCGAFNFASKAVSKISPKN